MKIFPNFFFSRTFALKICLHFFVLTSYLINFSSCLNFCCCIYNKDPFRGFLFNTIKMVSFDPSGMEKADIGNKLMKICYEQYNGFPSLDNINRLKKLKLVCEDEYEGYASRKEEKECENECSFLSKELNEKFNVKQEENRHKEAKMLKDRKNRLLKSMDKKVMENVGNFYKGSKCNISIKTKYKEMKPIFHKKIDKSKYEVDTGNTNDISFDSVTDIGDIKINTSDEKVNRILHTRNTDESSSNSVNPSSNSDNLEDGNIDLEKEIEKLEHEIMCLEHKNRRSIEYILDRFSIPDETLVRIIRIFERSLDDVIKTMRNYFEDTVYFQFRIADKLNKIQSKKAELKKI
jgi:hypothetical protein